MPPTCESCERKERDLGLTLIQPRPMREIATIVHVRLWQCLECKEVMGEIVASPVKATDPERWKERW